MPWRSFSLRQGSRHQDRGLSLSLSLVSLWSAPSRADRLPANSHRCLGCEVVLSGIEEQVSRANQHKEQQLGLKQQIESEVSGWGASRPDPAPPPARAACPRQRDLDSGGGDTPAGQGRSGS